MQSDRFRGLRRHRVAGLVVPVADSRRSRLLGLAWLDREQAGAGLLIPRCSSVHSCGMRFSLDLHFLDSEGATIKIHRRVPPCRIAWCRGADAVLELPAGQGGESIAAAA